MSCQYGCSTENIEDRCQRCGHPKKFHSWVHPHACHGERNKEGTHVETQCICREFTTDKVHAGTNI